MQEARAFQRIIKSYNGLKKIQDESLTQKLAVLVLQVIHHVKREPALILQVGKRLINDFAQETVENVTQDFLMDLLKYTSKENVDAYINLMKEIFQNFSNEALVYFVGEHLEGLDHPEALSAAFSHIVNSLTIDSPTQQELISLNCLWGIIQEKESGEVIVGLLKKIDHDFSFLEQMIAMWIDTAENVKKDVYSEMLALVENLVSSFCERDLHPVSYMFAQQGSIFLLLWNGIDLPGANQILMPVFERLANLKNPLHFLGRVNLVNEVLALDAQQFKKPEVIETLQRKLQAPRVRVSENTVLRNGKRPAEEDPDDAPSAQRPKAATH